ncbi:hypothetical protein GA0061098_1001123 [Bradyrhizobium shewense]|uniref:Uncharacterized protein n=1 Tax=Bradyrhizobium shewense TaxID=1761772 RepID=A0A1C3TYI8_9BRAD|nr:hypothetical protein GA0061098_1001123 [Bradyrhizobium shewense]
MRNDKSKLNRRRISPRWEPQQGPQSLPKEDGEREVAIGPYPTEGRVKRGTNVLRATSEPELLFNS